MSKEIRNADVSFSATAFEHTFWVCAAALSICPWHLKKKKKKNRSILQTVLILWAMTLTFNGARFRGCKWERGCTRVDSWKSILHFRSSNQPAKQTNELYSGDSLTQNMACHEVNITNVLGCSLSSCCLFMHILQFGWRAGRLLHVCRRLCFSMVFADEEPPLHHIHKWFFFPPMTPKEWYRMWRRSTFHWEFDITNF